MLIDTHCHLDKLDLTPYGNNIDQLINAACDVGVKQILNISVELSHSSDILSFTQRDGIFASIGVHPLYNEGLLETEDELIKQAAHPKVVAIGETGLDYFYEKTPAIHQMQQESFAIHLHAAAQLGLPVIVHTRDARQDTLQLIKTHGDSNVGGVLHCFTESYEMAKAALDENYLISISGIATFKTADELRSIIKKLPLETLLVETDAPYLAPVPHRGKKNEPKYVAEVAQLVADVKGIRYEAVLEQTANNFHNKFSRIDPNVQLNKV
ncbi:TatD family deoxyribonuclease [Marinomonas agarivorans]|nr:TatD family deoxyribonuclease [Marinomonas agarivorans]